MKNINIIKFIKDKEDIFNYGWCKTKLFGELEQKIDEKGVENKDIEVFYVIRRGSKENSPHIIFFNGGPGIGFSEHFFEHNGYKDFLPYYNLILMDQRGTGLSSKPKDNLYEYKYYSSKYISYDAEMIRKEILEDAKWIVFGQSFGGHLVRKYLELYGENALMGISHGYGECSPVTMKTSIEIELYKQVYEYFKKYPEDRNIIENIKSQLTYKDCIGNDARSVCGEGMIDIFSFYFGLYPQHEIHNVLQSFDKTKLKEEFICEISNIGNIILNSGILNSVVAYIDLIGGITDKELYDKVELELKKLDKEVDKEMFSFSRLSKHIESVSKSMKELEIIFKNKLFDIDPIDYSVLFQKLSENDINLHIFGSTNDPITPIIAINEERKYINKHYNKEKICFHYSNGNHREWIQNNKLFKGILT